MRDHSASGVRETGGKSELTNAPLDYTSTELNCTRMFEVFFPFCFEAQL